MQHRHLLPNEIDLLLDGEVGFGVSPLRGHVDECEPCRARLADARAVVEALERLPHFAPAVRFADQVLAQVQIVEPWHVAAINAAKRLVPQSAPMRVVMTASATVIAAAVSVSAVWLSFHADATLYAINLAADRARAALVNGAAGVIGDAFGQAGLDVVRSSGLTGLAISAGVVLAAIAGATFGFRALATASRRVRE
jgi:hypothetical protein